jgi:hypothetical protein
MGWYVTPLPIYNDTVHPDIYMGWNFTPLPISVVIDWEWRKIPTLIYSWVGSVVIDWEWRKIPTLIYSWVDSVVIDWEWREISTLNIAGLTVSL